MEKQGIAGPAFWVSGSGAGLRSSGEGNYSTLVSRAIYRLSTFSYESRKSNRARDELPRRGRVAWWPDIDRHPNNVRYLIIKSDKRPFESPHTLQRFTGRLIVQSVLTIEHVVAKRLLDTATVRRKRA
jgi:hypothetical protein